MSEWHDLEDALTTARKRVKWDDDAAAIAKAQDRIAALEATLREFADAVERLAFKMRAPNVWTPQFVQLAQAARVAPKWHNSQDVWEVPVKKEEDE